jgi:hypothetical protein
MTDVFNTTRRRAILSAMGPGERDAMRALRCGALIADGEMLVQLERRQLIRLQETSNGEVWVFTRLGGEIADWLINGPEPDQLRA